MIWKFTRKKKLVLPVLLYASGMECVELGSDSAIDKYILLCVLDFL